MTKLIKIMNVSSLMAQHIISLVVIATANDGFFLGGNNGRGVLIVGEVLGNKLLGIRAGTGVVGMGVAPITFPLDRFADAHVYKIFCTKGEATDGEANDFRFMRRLIRTNGEYCENKKREK
jgi:hypothetical protein